LEKIEMKKTLVAVAALMVATGAMAEVTISGMMEIGVSDTKNVTSNVGVKTTAIGDNNGNNVINIVAKEDLGSGMAADIQYGFGTSGDNGAMYSNYQTFAGLSGGFGRIQAGSFISPQFNVNAGGDATGAWSHSTAWVNQATTKTTRANEFFPANQLQYSLPTFVPGLGLALTRKFGETAGSNVGTADTISASYATGPFTLAYANTRSKFSVTETDVAQGWNATYDFGVAKVYFLSTSLKQGSADAITGMSYGISAPVGAFTFVAQIASASGVPSSFTANAVNATTTGFTASSTTAASTVDQSDYTLQARYSFSKRTTALVSTARRSGWNGTTAGAGDTSTVNRIYLQHTF
jgi:hypothetical protein